MKGVPQMSPFVPHLSYNPLFHSILIPVTLQPKGIGQANQAPAGSVPISANPNPSVGGFYLHWQIAGVFKAALKFFQQL